MGVLQFGLIIGPHRVEEEELEEEDTHTKFTLFLVLFPSISGIEFN